MKEKFIMFVAVVLTSIASFLVATYFGNFLLKADYHPENFVTKKEYNIFKIEDVKIKTTLEANIENIGKNVNEMKGDIKTLLQRK